jgi:hypothetical protein
MARYAEGTTVSSESSKAEIERSAAQFPRLLPGGE